MPLFLQSDLMVYFDLNIRKICYSCKTIRRKKTLFLKCLADFNKRFNGLRLPNVTNVHNVTVDVEVVKLMLASG